MRPSAWWPPRSAAAPGRRLDRSCSLPRVGLHPVLVEVAAVAVVDDDRGKAFDFKTTDRLGAQIFVGDDRELLDELAEHRAGAANGAEEHALVRPETVPDRLAAPSPAVRPSDPQPDAERP